MKAVTFGLLAVTKTNRVEILFTKIKLTRWENDPLQSVSMKTAEQTKESRKIASPQITAHVL